MRQRTRRVLILLALAVVLVAIQAGCQAAMAQGIEVPVPNAADPGTEGFIALLDWASARFGMPGAFILGVLYLGRAAKQARLALPIRLEGPTRVIVVKDCAASAGERRRTDIDAA